MRRIRFATLLTLAALSAAPLLHAAVTMEWRGTINEQANNVEGGRLNIDQMAAAGLVTGAEGTHTRIDTLVIFMSSYFTGARQIPARTVVKDDAGQIVGVFASTEGTTQNSTDHGKKSLTLPLKGNNLLEGSGGNLILANDETYTIYFADEDNLEAPSDTQDTSGNNVLLMALHTTSSLAEALDVEKTALDGLAAVNHNTYMVPFEFMGETVIVSPEGLSEALAALPADGGTVTLAGDVDASGVGAPIVLDKPVTLVGGGYTLTAPAEGPLFQVKADLTLDGVTIANENPAGHAIVVGDGTAALAEGAAGQTLTVTGETSIPGGIGVYEGQALTITGEGTLTVTGAPGCAAIGGSHDAPACGDIVIDMTGTLNADGGKDAASIGAGRAEAIAEPTGSITISSGTVNAKHDEMGGLGAAIGGGYNTAVAAIAITGGTVNAGEAANVRPEHPRSTGTWLENTWPTRLTAHVGGAAIGLGSRDPESAHNQVVATDISITGGTVNAYSRDCGSGIGGAYNASVASIEIGGSAKVYAVGSGGCAPIGGGPYGATVATVTIGGTAKVIAEAMLHRVLEEDLTGATSDTIGASAAIGGGYAGVAGNIHITDEAQVLAVNAGKGSYTWGTNETYTSLVDYDMADLSKLEGGAAIGTGRIPSHGPKDEKGQLIRGSITIDGQAQVWAYGGAGGAGIGGGHDSWSQTSNPDVQLGTAQNYPPITIGGTARVYAQGGVGASAIGGGQDAQHGSAIAIASTASVEAKAGLTKGEEGYTTPAAIGTGSYNVNDDHSVSGVVSATQVAEATLTVTGVTPAEDGSAMLPIVTLGANGTPENLTDSPGLTLSVTVGEGAEAQTFTVEKTVGSEAGNLISGLILDPEACIDSTPYATLEDAFAAAKPSDAITLLRDVVRDAVTTSTAVNVDVTLVGNGQKISVPLQVPFLTLNADLTLQDVVTSIRTRDGNNTFIDGCYDAHFLAVGADKAVTLTANGKNTVNGGIGVYDDTALTLAGTGELWTVAYGAPAVYGNAGIGAAVGKDCGDIVIRMGEGGSVEAIAYGNGAGIGAARADSIGSAVGSITIKSGSITAYGGTAKSCGAAIGGGQNSAVKTITIEGGTVVAGQDSLIKDHGDDPSFCGAGIGVGVCNTTVGTLCWETAVSITGGTVTAIGGNYGAGIGGAYASSLASISITGGTVTAIGQSGAAAIGGGVYGVGGQAITIGGEAKVIAEALLYREVDETIGGATTTTIGPGAAIGGGYAGKSGTIVIKDSAQVLATNAGVGSYTYWGGEQYTSVGTWEGDMTGITGGAAIGAGRIPSYPKDDMGSITIQGNAQVWAYGGRCNAGIGGGDGGWINPAKPDQILGASPNFPPISILGTARVVAKGGLAASGIGGGVNAQVGSLITIAYTADVKAWAGATAPNYTTPAAIGLGSYNADYQYSPDQRPSTLAPATQPTTTLRVTGATAENDGSLLLDIVTLNSADSPEDLTDSPGLALQVEIGETLYAVSKTKGTTEHNEVLKNTFVVNPVSGDILDVAESGALLLPLEDTFYLADADGNVVARVDKVGDTTGTITKDTTGTITKLDDALTLEPLSIYTKTGNLEKVTAADAADILGVEDHDTWVVKQAEDTLSSVAYVYDFGIAGLTIDKEGTLTAVTVKMTEGVERAPRNVTLANATLTVYADGTPIATDPAPAFGEDGTLTVTLGEAYTPGATSTLSVRLSLTEAPAP